jgi:20S proteasome alpha/beta subunit
MSICIALLSKNRKTVVCVTDERVAFGHSFSSDTIAQKTQGLYVHWVALVAGIDTEYADLIIQSARRNLSAHVARTNRPPTGEEVADALQQSYWRKLDELIEYQVLRRHKVTAEKFLRDGKRLFTPTIYDNLRNRMEKVVLRLQFLVCGFDEKHDGHIYIIDGKTPPGTCDSIGMWAIGNGSNSALSSLAFHADKHGLSLYSALEQSIYCALEAKFIAESAQDVGSKGTFVSILEPGNAQFMSDHGVAAIKKKWERQGAPKIPKSALDLIPKLLYGAKPKSKEEAMRTMDAVMGKPGYTKRLAAKREKAKATTAMQPSDSETSGGQR